MVMYYRTPAMNIETVEMEYGTICSHALALLLQLRRVKFFSGTIRNVSIYYVGICG